MPSRPTPRPSRFHKIYANRKHARKHGSLGRFFKAGFLDNKLPFDKSTYVWTTSSQSRYLRFLSPPWWRGAFHRKCCAVLLVICSALAEGRLARYSFYCITNTRDGATVQGTRRRTSEPRVTPTWSSPALVALKL